MSDEETLDALNNLWKNFCVSDTYEPGSTVKPFTVAARAETGALTGMRLSTAAVPSTSEITTSTASTGTVTGR